MSQTFHLDSHKYGPGFECASCPGCNIVDEDHHEEGSGKGTLNVIIHVVDSEGEPVADELVKLEDLNRTADTNGRTSDTGCLVIYQDTGPAPCTTYKLLLPYRTDVDAVETPCTHDGEFNHTFTLSQGEHDRQFQAAPLAGWVPLSSLFLTGFRSA